jgi:hypothetical protein
MAQTKSKMVMLRVRVPLDLRAAVHKVAETDERSFQTTVARLLRDSIGRKGIENANDHHA